MPPSRSCRSASFLVAMRRVLLILCLLTVTWVGVSAQIDRAVLEGTVTDATGAVTRGAVVKVLAVETGITWSSRPTANGYYRFRVWRSAATR